MIKTATRAMCLAGALTGGAALSQYPAFAQDYIQRLGGTVDALTEVAQDFDTSALTNGLTRSEALDQMRGTAFIEARAADMRRTFARQATLSDQLNRLRAATPLQQITLAPTLRDPETIKATWADFTPSLPISAAGAVTGAIGAIAGWLITAAALIFLRRPFRRKPHPPRAEPLLTRPAPNFAPRLPGETRPE